MSLDTLKALGVTIPYKEKYDNFIGGKWVAPVKGEYFDVISPITGKNYTKAARSSAEDVELALDAAHAAAEKWGTTSTTERANILLKIADRIEENLELIATADTVDNGKPIRETMNADIPLTVDHFRYFAGAIRAQEGGISEIDNDTIAYHFHEPLGVVGQIIPWNFPILMAAWKLAPALAAGNCVVLKPAEFTPISILVMIETFADLLPPGTVNIVNGYGREVGAPLANSKRIAKIGFTGSTATGRAIAGAAASNLIPATLELGGKSPNVFFADIMDEDDAFFDKAIEGLVLFAFNQGEVCTCPSRAIIQESIYEMIIFTEKLNGKKETVLGLAGIGDLYVSADGGRNSKMGEYLGIGMSFKEAKKTKMPNDTVEGADLALEIGTKLKSDFDNKTLPLMISMINTICDEIPLKINWKNFK